MVIIRVEGIKANLRSSYKKVNKDIYTVLVTFPVGLIFQNTDPIDKEATLIGVKDVNTIVCYAENEDRIEIGIKDLPNQKLRFDATIVIEGSNIKILDISITDFA